MNAGRILFGIAMNVLGLISVLAAMWPVAGFIFLVQPARIFWHLDGYRSAWFVVEGHDYVGYGAEDAAPHAHAKGRVEGVEEIVSLASVLKPFPRTEQELRRLVPVGTALRVLYNPEAGEDSIGGEFARVLPYEEDLRGRTRGDLWRGVRTVYLPILVCLPPTVAWVWLYRRWSRGKGASTEPRDVVEALLSPKTGAVYLSIAGVFLVFGLLVQVFVFFVT
jgi:hypothetical protein